MPTRSGLAGLVLIVSLMTAADALAVYDPMAELERSMRGGSTLQTGIRRQMTASKSGRLLGAGDWLQLQRFYAERDYKPLWVNGDGPAGSVAGILERIGATPFTGIDEGLLLTYAAYETGASDKQRLAGYEVLLSELLARYARVVAMGRFSAKAYDPEWYIRLPHFSLGRFMQSVAEGKQSVQSLLDQLQQRHIDFQRLIKVYRYYSAIAERGGWSPLPADMGTLKPGMRSKWVPFLRTRLRAEFSYTSLEADDSPHYDTELVEAVKVFQRRNGLAEDAVIGPKTRLVLNLPVEERLRSILSSMERWRWMPRKLDGRYLIVNIPAFELTLYEGDRQIWRTRVIVGRKARPTPSIESTISQLKVNPKWHVPDKIAVKDLVPKQLRNPRFLEQSGYQVLLRSSGESIDPRDIDWGYYRHARDFPYLIRQNAGERNALGRLKFEMPSKYAIYLHDTSSKNLFGREQRVFSSGCVRVQSPYELAGMLLDKSEPENGRWKVLKEIDTGETKYLRLPEKVPVYLTYFTAWVDEQGQAHFRQDVYGRNKKFADVSVIND
jgi:murein L,D-transpeptidase YcbB/YkuD